MQTIDLQSLLTPVSTDHPVGDDLRYEGTYDRIRDARREDDPTLPQGVWQTELKRADWQQVAEVALAALSSRSKDLQIAVWLMEAWMNLYGFAGVRTGLQLIYSLCESYWETMYPALDSDDPDYRLAPIYWLNEKLSLRMKQIPITSPGDSDLAAYTWAQWEQILEREKGGVAPGPDMPSREKLAASAESTPRAFFDTNMTEMRESLRMIEHLDTFFDQMCGRNAPGMVQFRDLLQSMLHQTGMLAGQNADAIILADPVTELSSGDSGESAEESDTADIITEISGAEEAASADTSAGLQLRSRADAYRLLGLVADYLQRIEPHSPTPYLIRRAITWGNMSLAEVLRELMASGQDLTSIYRFLGIAGEENERE